MAMKTVKIHFIGFWPVFQNDNNMFYNILKNRYHVVLDDKDPDFLICSPLGVPFEYTKYDCPRIMYTGEYFSADFTSIDYFIGFDDISFGDRSFRLPLYLYSDHCQYPPSDPLTHDQAMKILKSKEYFCNYIFGHQTQMGIREEILDGLAAYRRVECAGTHRNNMPNGLTLNIQNKFDFMKKCKFSIAAESVSYPGFTSEKIGHAFRTCSIPIYYGDPDVTKDFNENSFVNYSSFENVDALVKRVIELDQNDDLYIEMLCQYRYVQANFEAVMLEKFTQYLYNIFDQDKEEAYRRPRYYRSQLHENYLHEFNRTQTALPHRILRKLKL